MFNWEDFFGGKQNNQVDQYANQWGGYLNQIGDPTNYIGSILGKYISSPMAQQQIGGSTAASTGAASASGMGMSPELSKALQGTATNAAYQGQQDYLNAALRHMQNQLGFNQAMSMQMEGQREQQAQREYQQNLQDQQNKMGSIGSLGALGISLL